MAKGKHAKKIGRAPNFPSSARCECEHVDHFGDDESRQKGGGGGHEYGARFSVGDVRGVKTPYRTFRVCMGCAIAHHGLGKRGGIWGQWGQ